MPPPSGCASRWPCSWVDRWPPGQRAPVSRPASTRRPAAPPRWAGRPRWVLGARRRLHSMQNAAWSLPDGPTRTPYRRRQIFSFRRLEGRANAAVLLMAPALEGGDPSQRNQVNAGPPQVDLLPLGGADAEHRRPWGRSAVNAGPPQVDLLPLGGADAEHRRPWGRSAVNAGPPQVDLLPLRGDGRRASAALGAISRRRRSGLGH